MWGSGMARTEEEVLCFGSNKTLPAVVDHGHSVLIFLSDMHAFTQKTIVKNMIPALTQHVKLCKTTSNAG